MIWHSAELQAVLDNFSSDANTGLTTEQASKLYKENKSEIKKAKPSFIKILLSQFTDYVTLITVIAIIISVTISFISDNAGWIAAVCSAVLILLYSVLKAVQIFSAEKAEYNITHSLSYSVKVIRDGTEQVINSEQLVSGDIILLQAGDLIPADARLIEAVNLRCDEFILTRETVDTEKDALSIAEDIAQPSFRKNMVFAGCCVAHGTAKAIVVDTGKNTELSKLKKIKKASENSDTAFGEFIHTATKYSLIIASIIAFISFIAVIFLNLQTKIGFANLVSESFLNSMAIVFAAIPSALPASAGLILWFAIKKHKKNGNSMFKISTLEKIAGISVICADKTGVLTPDKMSVARIFSGKGMCNLSETAPDTADIQVVKMAMLCGNSIDFGDNAFKADRDSGDKAIEEFCVNREGLKLEDSLNIYPMEASVPFDNERKIITSINMIDGKHYVISKGAPEEIIKICDNINSEAALKVSEEMASEGLRVIAVATKQIEGVPAIPNANELEYGLNFLGFIGLEDKPDSKAVNTVAECLNLGIRTVIITGDGITTAKAVARRLGIFPDGMKAVTGAEIQNMSDDELFATVNDYSVFARVSPDDKYRIVKALKNNGETVAVTGFKNSDAAVLRKADVGFTKSDNTSDVVMSAADIVVENIKLNNLLKIIKSALSVFYNVNKTICYYLCCNISTLLAVLLGLLIFGSNIFIAPQLLLISTIIGIIPAFAMCFLTDGERTDNNRFSAHKRLLSLNNVISVGIQSVCICTVTLFGYSYGNTFSASCGQTAALCILAFSQILHLIPNFSDKLMINCKISSYIPVFCAAAAGIAIMLICTLTPLNAYFGFALLKAEQWQYVINFSLIFILIDILTKIGLRIFKKN